MFSDTMVFSMDVLIYLSVIVLETQYSGDTIVLVFPDGSSPALLSAMMAGIPYNKAHELEFVPGEIRLDVTMQNTLDLYSTKKKAGSTNREEYTAMVQRGEKELQRLRSLTAEEIVSKKDQMIEKERMEIDKAYRLQSEARLNKDENDRQARLERQLEMEAERQRQRGVVPVDGDDNGSSLPPLAIGGALAAYVVVALSGGKVNDEEAVVIATESLNNNPADGDGMVNATPSKNESGTEPSAPSIRPNGPLVMNDVSFEETIQGQGSTKSNSNAEQKPSLYSSSIPPKIFEEDRREAAARAMKDYLDADDGADAWLQALGQIRDEEEEEGGMPLGEEEEVISSKINGDGDDK
jgi:hypothetical protein